MICDRFSAWWYESGDISRRNAWERRFQYWKATGTFLLLTCLRTHYIRHCEPFSGQKCTRLQDFAYTISTFVPQGWYFWIPSEAPAPSVLGPRHQFPLGLPAFPLFRFSKRSLVWIRMYNVCRQCFSSEIRRWWADRVTSWLVSLLVLSLVESFRVESNTYSWAWLES